MAIGIRALNADILLAAFQRIAQLGQFFSSFRITAVASGGIGGHMDLLAGTAPEIDLTVFDTPILNDRSLREVEGPLLHGN